MNLLRVAAPCVAMLLSTSSSVSAQESTRGITHVTGDLYQVYDENNTFTAFLVTPAGIILTDPIGTHTATWLKAELASRFDVPVKYLIYRHGTPRTGRGASGDKEDVTEFRKYFEALYAKIVEAKKNGLTKDEAVATIELPEYDHLGMYDPWFKMNVEGMFRHLTTSEQERP